MCSLMLLTANQASAASGTRCAHCAAVNTTYRADVRIVDVTLSYQIGQRTVWVPRDGALLVPRPHEIGHLTFGWGKPYSGRARLLQLGPSDRGERTGRESECRERLDDGVVPVGFDLGGARK